ncbi:MAG: hypothetical protein ABIR71_11495 [Chthoniobacterales bacterium]
MLKRFICLFMAGSALGAVSLSAQEGAATAEGTLTLEKKTYTLKRALAYETKIDGEEAIAVVLSGQPITSEKLKEAREAEKDGSDGSFQRPFLKLVFKKTGEFKFWSAAAGGTMLGRQNGAATGDFKTEGGRINGKAGQPMQSEGMFPAGFDAQFNVALLKTSESLPPSTAKKGGPAANVKPTVTGVFRGNGKEAKVAYLSARWVEPFSGKPGIELIFTEKDHSKDKKPNMGAMFGRFGSALIISLHEDGQIYSCQVVHSAHEKQGFSTVGQLEATDFIYEDGKVEGELTTSGELDTFGEKWEVKLKFVAPLGEIPKEFQVAEAKEAEKEGTSEPGESDDEGETGGAGPKAKELALTKDATDIEYKAMVGQLSFKSKSNVKGACAELAAGLKAQGWKTEGRDMVNPQSSILRRKLEKATLTIFVKPDAGGSEVKMMTEGLSWE